MTAFGSAGERQAGCNFPVPTFALPMNVTFSLTTSRGASISPRSVQFACSSQDSVTKILPSTVPRTFTDFVLISPRMHACSPIVSVPVDSIVPSTSPSMSSSFRNLTEPVIETPRERRAPDCVGMDVWLEGPGTTDGSGRFVCCGSVPPREGKRVKGGMARIVPKYPAFRKPNRVPAPTLFDRRRVTLSSRQCPKIEYVRPQDGDAALERSTCRLQHTRSL